jgi:hypothetical protein
MKRMNIKIIDDCTTALATCFTRHDDDDDDDDDFCTDDRRPFPERAFVAIVNDGQTDGRTSRNE